MENTNEIKKTFSLKSFVCFLLFFTFLIVLITGVSLYFMPHGKFGEGNAFNFFGLNRHNWRSIHTVFSFTFVILNVIHLFILNWKIFWSYIFSNSQKKLNHKTELIFSIIIILILIISSLSNITF